MRILRFLPIIVGVEIASVACGLSFQWSKAFDSALPQDDVMWCSAIDKAGNIYTVRTSGVWTITKRDSKFVD